MNVELTHGEAQNLFGAWVDAELGDQEELGLRAHLDDCADCRTGWQRYERVVKGARNLEHLSGAPEPGHADRPGAPRRRRGGGPGAAPHLRTPNTASPAEVIIPILKWRAAVAALLFFSAS